MPDDKINITWEASDGYAGGSAPQHLTLRMSDFADCDTEEEVTKFLEEAIQEDFAQKVSWGCENFSKHVEDIMKVVRAREE